MTAQFKKLEDLGLLKAPVTIVTGPHGAQFFTGVDPNAGISRPVGQIVGAFGQIRTFSKTVVEVLNTGFLACSVNGSVAVILPDRAHYCSGSPRDLTLAAGSFYIIGEIMAAPISYDPIESAVYGAVLDSDGDLSDNYAPSVTDPHPNDRYQGSDLWYEMLSLKTSGWVPLVTDWTVPNPARNNAAETSKARAIMWGNLVIFVIPASEARRPAGFRTTTIVTNRLQPFLQGSTATDAMPGGPGSGWPLAPLQVVP